MSLTFPEAAAHFLGYRYAVASKDNRYPVARGCLPAGLVHKPGQKKLIDCSTFITACVCYMDSGRDWDQTAYADMQIMDAGSLWSPLDAWERHGVGQAMAAGEMAGQWGIYQSWVDDQAAAIDGDPISGGHQWAYHGGLGIRIHSSSRGATGPTREHVTFNELLKHYKAGVRGVRVI